MNDADIHQHIESLVRREHELLDHASAEGHGLSDEERKELDRVQVQLDRYFDLLRQRRARVEFGQDPNDTEMRSGKTVESYWQ
ncbi:MAG: DUF2630 family protein [Candidatus Eremiobacteraeota bacterium]|nr:DUF2630 family protein [Candidatus Eremiobacteraeota bacterium]